MVWSEPLPLALCNAVVSGLATRLEYCKTIREIDPWRYLLKRAGRGSMSRYEMCLTVRGPRATSPRLSGLVPSQFA